MKIDGKFSVWQRFSVPESYQEELKRFLEENPETSFNEIYDWAHERDLDPTCETLESTEESISVADNAGQATVEVETDGGAPVWDNRLIKGNRLKPEGRNPFKRVSTDAGIASVMQEIYTMSAFPGSMLHWDPEQIVEAAVSWCGRQLPPAVKVWWLKMDDALGDEVVLFLDIRQLRDKCIQLVAEHWCKEKAEALRQVEFDSGEWQETWQDFKALMVESKHHYYSYGEEALGEDTEGRRFVDLLSDDEPAVKMTHRHRLIFARQEGLSVTTTMFCEFRSEDAMTPAMNQLRQAVTRWLNETESGRIAWTESVEDFNIGDLASYATPDFLQAYGITDLQLSGADGMAVNFDTVLNDKPA